MNLVEDHRMKDLPRREVAGIYLFAISSVFVILALGQIVLDVPMADYESIGSLSATIESALHRLLIIVLALIIVVPLHEGLHGCAFGAFGGKVRYGATLKSRFGPVFWATARGSFFSRRQFQVVALAPQALTVALLGVLILVPLSGTMMYACLVAMAGNLGGGCVDIYTLVHLQRYPRDYRVEDCQDGFKVYAP